jgi:hypothetical protein
MRKSGPASDPSRSPHSSYQNPKRIEEAETLFNDFTTRVALATELLGEAVPYLYASPEPVPVKCQIGIRDQLKRVNRSPYLPGLGETAKFTLCPRGDLNPHALSRALAPQASASTYSATRTYCFTSLGAHEL